MKQNIMGMVCVPPKAAASAAKGGSSWRVVEVRLHNSVLTPPNSWLNETLDQGSPSPGPRTGAGLHNLHCHPPTTRGHLLPLS